MSRDQRPPTIANAFRNTDYEREIARLKRTTGNGNGGGGGSGIVPVDTLPPSGSLGDAVYLTTDNGLYVWEDGWQKISQGAPGPQGNPGAVGPAGPAGPSGPQGSSTSIIPYTFSALTGVPPAAGQVRVNNTDQTAASSIFLAKTDRNGVDVTAPLLTIAGGDQVYIQRATDSAYRQVYSVLVAFDSIDRITLIVTWLSGGTQLANGDVTTFGIVKTGRPGNPGAVLVFEQPNQPTTTQIGAIWIDTDGEVPQWPS